MDSGTFAAVLATTRTGREIAGRDWTATPLGPIACWPIALKTSVATMLGCPTAMYLAWGPDLVSFFNDAYRPILGIREDQALGQPFRTLWGHIWDDIGPLVDATLAGESRLMTDMPLDLARGGVPEESWWTFSYSPAYGDDGRIAGLLCVTAETTARVLADRERDSALQRMELALSAGNSIGAWDWDILADRVITDPRFALLYGVDPAVAAAGVPLVDFLRGIHAEDRPLVTDAIHRAVATGDDFTHEYRLVDGMGTVRWISAQARALRDTGGRSLRLPGISFDVTERRRIEEALRAAKDERDFIVALTARQRAVDSPEAILRLSVEAVGERLGAARACFYRLVAEDRVRFGPCWTGGRLDPLEGELDEGRLGAAALTALRGGNPLIFADSRSEADGTMTPLADAGIVSGIFMPLVRHGRTQAGLAVHDGEVREWTQSDAMLMREVAELTMLAVERAEATIRMEHRIGQQDSQLALTTNELRTQAARRSAAESQLRQLQKMEAVGQLTGGIAHDFNNMLAVIIGGLNLMQRRLERGDADVGRYVEAAMDAAGRAAALTQRLLAFARQAPLSPEAVDANRLVAGLADLLERTLGERVRLETVLGAGLWKARADPNQLENVIINLAVNARDAMPDGGCLTIETSNAHMDEAYAAEEGTRAGQYVLIAVTDTGSGMDADTMARAFDPFFTTKGVGKGTGLGLSQVFGFASQSGGHVKCYSEVGHGTTFKVYLPRLFGEAPVALPRRAADRPRNGDPSEVVMVVEDEDRLRNFTVEALRELGYTVIHAMDGAEALAMIRAGQAVTLLLTDIVMPGLTGRQLADAARPLLPEMKVLYMTGYTRNAVVHNGTLDPGTRLLSKPFGLDRLAIAVREALEDEVG
ncbi:MAG: ATP-binding protein [Sphingomonas fennica]